MRSARWPLYSFWPQLHSVPSGLSARLRKPGATIQVLQLPDMQTASPPQLAPSALAGFPHTPLVLSQVPALWHESLAAHTTGLAPLHTPAWQLSVFVHASPSEHVAPSVFAGLLHTPLVLSQIPVVWHWSGVAHTTGLLPTHVPALQASTLVQASPSSHGAWLSTCTQP